MSRIRWTRDLWRRTRWLLQYGAWADLLPNAGVALEALSATNLSATADLADGPRHLSLGSEACREQHFTLPEFRLWMRRMNLQPRVHRKQWEFFYVAQALWEQGVIEEGRRGLGFGVGREPLADLFASFGCDVVATDQAPASGDAQAWAETGQHSASLRDLHDRGITPDDLFTKRVRFRHADMNAIPGGLERFDFCWSACALEHLGSLRAGLDFVKNSVRCLVPGGVAVHTTEINLDSERHTLRKGSTVAYRRKDLRRLARELRGAGHFVAPLRLRIPRPRHDHFVAGPPHLDVPHIRLWIGGYVCTSFGIIVRRAL